SCLRRTDCDRLLVLAVDLPFVKREFLQGLIDHGGGVAVQAAGGGHFEAVVAVYTKECLAIAEAQLERGEYAMQKFILDCIADGRLSRRSLTGGEQRQLKNLNRPEDL
ncbi:MAG: molybdenum cofactor guanylyltransferase, partial [Verrucomicrobiales bacterium]